MNIENDARVIAMQARDMGVGHQTSTVEVYRSWMTRVADVVESLTAEWERSESARQVALRDARDRELHHFEAEKALAGLSHLADALDADGQPSIATVIRAWIPADVLATHSSDLDPGAPA